MPNKSPNDVFTMDDQAYLIEVGDNLSNSKFLLGWKIAECIDEHTQEATDVTANDIYQAATKFVRAPVRTIRYYTEIAKRFPRPQVEALLEKYPSLAFSHFAYARKRKYQEPDRSIRFLIFAGRRQLSPENAEWLFDQRIGLAQPREPDLHMQTEEYITASKDVFIGIVRKRWGSAQIPRRFTGRMLYLWREMGNLLREIDQFKKDNPGIDK